MKYIPSTKAGIDIVITMWNDINITAIKRHIPNFKKILLLSQDFQKKKKLKIVFDNFFDTEIDNNRKSSFLNRTHACTKRDFKF